MLTNILSFQTFEIHLEPERPSVTSSREVMDATAIPENLTVHQVSSGSELAATVRQPLGPSGPIKDEGIMVPLVCRLVQTSTRRVSLLTYRYNWISFYRVRLRMSSLNLQSNEQGLLGVVETTRTEAIISLILSHKCLFIGFYIPNISRSCSTRCE